VAHLVDGSLVQEYGGPADRISAWWGQDGQAFGGEDVLFPEGYDWLPRHLAQGLDVRTGARVAEVAPDGVTLADGARIAASRVVVTVPLGVLKAGGIGFARPLSAGREAALERLEMGNLSKLWLRFDRVAWPDDVDWIEWLGPQAGHWAQWVSLARAAAVPVLLAFHGGRAAEAMDALPEGDAVAAARDALRSMFGSAFPAPVAVQKSGWSVDPLSRGAYSFTPAGATPEDRDALAGPDWDGALWFAGEAASRGHFGTVHGAHLSGLAVARAMG
jgi:monoamine oxidase